MLNSARVHYALDARSRDGAAWPLRKAAREVRREKIYSYYRYSLEFAQTSLPRSKRVAALSRGASAGPSRRMDGRRTREDQGGPGRTRKEHVGNGIANAGAVEQALFRSFGTLTQTRCAEAVVHVVEIAARRSRI